MSGTPSVFRYRILLIFLCYFASAGLAFLLAPFPPFPSLVGLVSLPSVALYGSTAPVSERAPWLILPFALVAVAFALRMWGTSYLTGSVMSDPDLHADRLIVRGPFRFVRNPLYLGNVVLSVAFGLLFPPPGLLLAFGLNLVVSLALIAHEEAALAAAHPDAFRAYAARVPRLLPRLSPVRDFDRGARSTSSRFATADARPDWRNGFLSEAWLLLIFLGAIFATANAIVGWAIWFVGLGSLVAVRFVSRRVAA